MLKTKNFVYWGLYSIAWLIFICLLIDAGTLIVNFFSTLIWPMLDQTGYYRIDLSESYNNNIIAFYTSYSFELGISILKAYLFYIVIRLVHKMDLAKPFNTFVSKQILQISFYTISVGLLSLIAKQSTKRLLQGFESEALNHFWVDSQAFIIMGAVIYIIATIFKKGVDIQNENDLKV